MKISRNEACPCGSGLKYKKCCLTREQSLDTFKMSEVMLDFAQELLEKANNSAQKESAIHLACFAWNLALVDVSERQPMTDKILATMAMTDEQDKQTMHQLLTALMIKKQSEYAWCHRLIVNCEVYETQGDLRLHIASVDISPR